MRYFNSLPLVSITDTKKNTQVFRNIFTRLNIIPSILNNPLVYYTYDIQEGDTPEIVADKYYGDSYRYWIVLFCNQMIDPQWDWPLDSVNLEKYIEEKYANTGINVYTDVKRYLKSITQYNAVTNTTTVDTVEISENEYNNLIPYEQTLTFSTETIKVNVTKSVQNYYDYEVEQNESKRNIKLLNKIYVPQIEAEFKSLVR